MAIERAATSGQPTITGKIALVQDGKKQAGFLYLVPVYKTGSHPTTPEERLAALDVLVYAPIILEEAVEGVAAMTMGDIDFEIFDGEVVSIGYGIETTPGASAGELQTSEQAQGWLQDPNRFPVILRFTDDRATGNA